MTTGPTDLLRQAETYLATLHEHAARHDNLGADFACAGCALRKRIAALPAEELTVPSAPADTDLRDRIAGAIHADLLAHQVRRDQGLLGIVPRLTAAVLAVLPAPSARAAVLPLWEAVYEPGNVSDYLIGYANTEAAAKGAAEAWMRSQAEVTGRLEWVADEQLTTGRYDRWYELIEHHDDGVPTGPGIIVRRLAGEAQQVGEGTPSGAVAAELRQREAYLQALRGDPAETLTRRERVRGEVLGLRDALDILHGAQATSSDRERGDGHYKDWLTQHAECGAQLVPRTGTRPCVLPAGHDGTHHQDRHTNRWPVDPQPAGEAQRAELAAPCTAALLPLGSEPVDPCIRRGKHDSHKTASGVLWGNGSDDEEPTRG